MDDTGKIEDTLNFEGMMNYKINNVVATVNIEIKEKLELVQIARKIKDVEYNPERFPGLILKIDNPKVTFLIFSTGKMVLTGLKTIENAHKAVKKIVKKFRKIGIKLNNPVVTIENLVANGDLNSSINLDKAAITLDNTMYEPEVFPGLIYRSRKNGAVFLVFSTGKYVCVGTNNEEEILTAVMNLFEVINEHDLVRDNPVEESFDDLVFI